MRRLYVESEQKPSYQALADEFRVPLGTVCNVASEEGWVLMRSRFLSAVEEKVGAQEGLIELAKGNREVAFAFTNLALVGVKRLTRVIESIPEDTKPRAEIGYVQDASFAAANFAKSLREIGVMCFPKELTDSLGKGDAGKDFLKGALQQINITVQAAQSAAGSAVVDTPSKPTDEAPPL